MAVQLDPLTLGLVLAGLGMGGTLLTLLALSFVVDLLKRLFPAEVPSPKSQVPGAPAEPAAASPGTEDSRPGTS